MSRIETWFKSKRAISDNPISWLSRENHYKKFKKTVSNLNNDQLKQERARYNHSTRNDLLITSLGIMASLGLIYLVAPLVDPLVTVFSSGPTGVAVGLMGITRGIIRDSEKRILQKEIVMRKIH